MKSSQYYNLNVQGIDLEVRYSSENRFRVTEIGGVFVPGSDVDIWEILSSRAQEYIINETELENVQPKGADNEKD